MQPMISIEVPQQTDDRNELKTKSDVKTINFNLAHSYPFRVQEKTSEEEIE